MKKFALIFVVILFVISSVGVTFAEVEEVEPVETPEPIVIVDRIAYWEEHPEEAPYQRLGDIRHLATVADAVADSIETYAYIDASDDIKIAIMECCINRLKASGFPSTIEGVCTQKNQWQGLTSESEASYEARRLAEQVLTKYESGEMYEQLIPTDCVYMTVYYNRVGFRSEWDGDDTFSLYY